MYKIHTVLRERVSVNESMSHKGTPLILINMDQSLHNSHVIFAKVEQHSTNETETTTSLIPLMPQFPCV